MDAYTWEAQYKDGSLIQEWTGNAYKDVDRSNLETFVVYHADDLQTPVITIQLQPGRHLVWRKRRLDNSLLGLLQTTFIAGWISDDERHATFIVRNELFGVDTKRYDTDDFDIELSEVHGDLTNANLM